VALQPLLLLERKARGRAAPLELGPYLPTPMAIIDALLDLAGVGPADVVADLGCGDGRVLVRAARRGAHAVGVERDPTLADAARRAARTAGVADRVDVLLGDVEQLELRPVTAVVLFLDAAVLPCVVDRLRGQLQPGSRVVAHEQAAVAEPADRRCPVFTPAGITVAYRWDV
jgi:precorrin-6B methylase 2